MEDIDLFLRMAELSKQGFQCAQILMMLGLESEGKENSDLLRAIGGLNNGLADTSDTCGALSGCCCLISYFAGKGDADELEDPSLSSMISEFANWFKEEYGKLYGGHICAEILNDDPKNKLARCPEIVKASYFKAMEILEKADVI